MSSTITAIAVSVALTVWHVFNRRQPGWHASVDGRLTIYCGYCLVIIASYWLVTAPTATTWEWVLGNAWALAAMVAFVSGFGALRRAAARHERTAQLLETLEPAPAGDRLH
ncbi:MAG: hypothetical protein SW019_22905 [Actinomycetota bacterium]|nr:hypothetical protein [Actinomycetota bacterium]